MDDGVTGVLPRFRKPGVWTPEQVEAMDIYQDLDVGHPYTCRSCESNRPILEVTDNGLFCPTCGAVQTDVTPPSLEKMREIRAMVIKVTGKPRMGKRKVRHPHEFWPPEPPQDRA